VHVLLQVPDVNGILDRLLLFLGYEKSFVAAESLILASVLGLQYIRVRERFLR